MGDLIGQILHGYEIREQIGAGGFGAVYKAYQPRLKREVALKIILPKYANDSDFIRRFEVEAELVASLEHPHIVPLFDFWREPNGAYLVLRFLRGGSLHEFLQNDHLSLNAIANLLDQITAALHVAHRNNVVHRDIKPANILLDTDGNAYLTDFGIAKVQGVDSLSPDGSLTGSLPYVAPEQIQHGTILPQTDIYALGIVLYEMLAQKHPFPSTSVSEILYNHLQQPVPDIRDTYPSYPLEINNIIQKATAKDLTHRYNDVRLMAKAFREAISPHTPPSVTADTEIIASEATVVVTDTTAELSNPYKGLLAFQQNDAHLFFGRESSVERLLIGLSKSENKGRFLAVVGPSGSGKSSLVKAGLIPALRQGALRGSEAWFVVEMTPGEQPLVELEAALLRIAVNPLVNLIEQLRHKNGLTHAVERVLPHSDDEVLLVIDQFEEVFTLVADEDVRRQFFANLVQAAYAVDSHVHIVITLRADFYDRPLQYRDFGKLLQECTETILPMSSDELHQAIETPALQAGVKLQTGLIETLVNAVENQPSPLPLLQYALTDLFEKRAGHILTLDAYQAIGGVASAVATRADYLLQQLGDAYQTSAKQLFLRLVTLNEGTEVLRRRVYLTELLRDGDTEHILERYVAHRLLTFDRDSVTHEPTVEVAHEALLTTWGRLREWIEDSRDDLRIHQRLASATREWIEAEQHPEFLVRGLRLAQFEAWLPDSHLKLNEEEQRFITISIQEREIINKQESARQAHEFNLQRQAAIRLRYLALTLTLGLLVASGLLIFAFDNQQKAQAEAHNAQTQVVRAANNEATSIAERIRADESARISRSHELAVQSRAALDDHQIDLALLLSLEALQTAETYEAKNSLLTALTHAPRLQTIRHDHTDQVRSVVYDPSGQFLATASADQRIILRNATDGIPIGDPLIGHRNFINTLAFSSDGTRLASGGADQMIMIWDTQIGERLGEPLIGHEDEVWSVAFSPDDQILASAGEDGTILIWDVQTGEQIGEPLIGHDDFVFSLKFAPDGQSLASGSADNTIRLWDIPSGELMGEPLIGHTNWVLSIDFSSDGQSLASGSADNTVRLWDATSHELIADPLMGHTNWVRSVAFNPNGEYLASGGTDNLVLVWDIETGGLIDNWNTGHQDGVWSVAFNVDGNQVATGGADGTVRLWNMQKTMPLSQEYHEHQGQIGALIFMSDQPKLVSVSSDGTGVVATNDGTAMIAISEIDVQDVISMRISPDGQIVAFGDIEGHIILWDMPNHENLGELELDTPSIIFALAFSPDGTLLASGDDSGTITLWDIVTQRAIGELFIPTTEHIQVLAFNIDSSILASGDQNKTVILWDVATGQPLSEALTLHRDRILSLAFSADGQVFASGDRLGNIIVWDIKTQEPITQLSRSDEEIFSLAFSNDGNLLAAGGRDQTVTLWDINSGGILAQPLPGHQAWIMSLAFNPDGTILASGDRSGSVRVWDVSLASWTVRACQIAARNLTTMEWQRFIPTEMYQETCKFD